MIFNYYSNKYIYLPNIPFLFVSKATAIQSDVQNLVFYIYIYFFVVTYGRNPIKYVFFFKQPIFFFKLVALFFLSFFY